MPKRGRHRRRGGEVTSRATRPLTAGGPPVAGARRSGSGSGTGTGPDPALVADVRAALRSDTPVELLVLVSGVLASFDDQPAGGTLDALVGSLADVDSPESTALLAALAAMADDALAQERARRALVVRSGRLQRLPDWLRYVADVSPGIAVEVVPADGDRDAVVFAVRVPPRHDLCVVVSFDHVHGTVLHDGFVISGDMHDLIRRHRWDADDQVTCRPVDQQDARACVTRAIERAARTGPPPASDTWPACRPLVEWLLRRLPERPGPVSAAWSEWSYSRLAGVARRFRMSPFGARHRTRVHRDLLDVLLRFGSDEEPRDPLQWTPARVGVLLTEWIPGEAPAPAGELAQVPDLLRDLVRFSHAELAIPPDVTAATLDAVDRSEPTYQRLIRAGVALAGRLGDGGALDALGAEVGGPARLAALSDAPLPHEDVAWHRVWDDLWPWLRAVTELCDRWCDEVTGPDAPEYRTACRRFLTAVAAAKPKLLLRRGGKAESAAAAVCWAVGTANRLFDPGVGGRRVRDVTSHFHVPNPASGRGRTFVRAAGFRYADGGAVVVLDARYLVSSYRRSLVEARDRALAGGRTA